MNPSHPVMITLMKMTRWVLAPLCSHQPRRDPLPSSRTDLLTPRSEESKDEDIKETVEKRDAETTDDDLNIREVGEIFSHLCII